MQDKTQAIKMLREEFNRWEELLADMSAERASNSILYANRSIKDDLAHLWVWQRISVARMEAAINTTEPLFDWFPKEFEPESETDKDAINEWIYQTNKERSWSDVYKNWRENFLRFIELAEMLPENDLLDPHKYACLAGHPLILVLSGSYEHHHEDHFLALREWLLKHTN